jgi:hypothetical protein
LVDRERTSAAATIGVVAIAKTKRRRFLWCAWWSSAPTRKPYRKPDAWAGGALSEEEAIAEAERVAGRPLRLIESEWAGAWVRIRAGLPPWFERSQERGAESAASASAPSGESAGDAVDGTQGRMHPDDPHVVLGVPRGASLDEVKRAFRKAVLEAHPDLGGDAAAFRRIKRAYDRLTSPRTNAGRARRR